jgi:outer membrane protein assembly factor BamB
MVYQGGSYPHLIRSIDAETGIQDWQVPNGRQTSSATVVNDHVIFGAYDNRVYSLWKDTGAVDWMTPIGDWPDSSAVVHEGRVYIGSGIGDYVPSKPSLLYCLDETNGDIIWTFQAGGQIVASPTIADDTVIFGSYDENIYAVPTEDPNGDGVIDLTEVVWIFNIGARVVSSAAVEDDVVYVGSHSGKLYALPLFDPNGDGTIEEDEVIWTFSTGNEIWSSPGISRGRVFVGSHDNYLYALPKADPNGDGTISENEVLWKYKTTDRIWSSPSIAGGKVFIGSEDYTVWALTEETGVHIWNYTMPLQVDPYGSEYLYASATIVNGRVYVGNFDLTLYCFGDDIDSTLPTVTSVSPTNNTLDVALSIDIEVSFSEDLVGALITDASLVLQSSSGDYTTGQVTFSNVTRRLVFNPDEDLLPDERYTVRAISRYFQDYAGNPLDGNGNGILNAEPYDDYIWYFNTSKQIGHKPGLDESNVTPQQGYMDTVFEFSVIYTDEDNDVPTNPPGYIKIFIDGSLVGADMLWAHDTNTPLSHLLDRDYTNGELFHFKTQLDYVGLHTFYIECFDGSNTNKTPLYFLPTVFNTPPELAIPTQYASEDEEHSLDIRPYANDIDNDVSSLTFLEESEYCEIVDSHFLSCLFGVEGLLSEVVKVTVSDGLGQAWQNVLYIINPVNDGPTLRPGITRLPSVTVDEDSLFLFDLDEYITDPDTPKELLQVSDNSDGTTPVGLELYLLYDEPTFFENVTLTVSDGSESLQLYLEVNIVPANVTQPETLLPYDDNVFLWFLMVVLGTVIGILVLINIWIVRRRRKEQRQYPPPLPYEQITYAESEDDADTISPERGDEE